jgi:prephenate dehydrogenase
VLFERIGIIGVGLIGGSLALAARRAGVVREIMGAGRTAANLETALRRGIIDRAVTDFSQLGGLDLVVLAMPIGATERVARELLPHLQPGTIVTDVGSVKAPIVSMLDDLCPPTIPFVGAHPIAGSDESGAVAADVDLFRGARCVLTPTPRTEADALDKIDALWRAVGAVVERMDPTAHDRALAWTSHVVHIVAYALAGATGMSSAELARCAGPSFREATRVARSAPQLWAEILSANAGPVSEVTAALASELSRFRDALLTGDVATLRALLERGHDARMAMERSSR